MAQRTTSEDIAQMVTAINAEMKRQGIKLCLVFAGRNNYHCIDRQRTDIETTATTGKTFVGFTLKQVKDYLTGIDDALEMIRNKDIPHS